MNILALSSPLVEAEPATSSRQQAFSARLALALVLTWGLLLRLWDLRQPFLGDYAWNEAYYAYIARSFFQGDMLVQKDLFSGGTVPSFPLVPWIIYGSFRLFGPVEWAARLPYLIFGMTALIVLFCLSRILYGNRVALVAAFLASTMPGVVFFSRNVQLDGIMATLGLAAVLAMVLYRRREHGAWLAVSLLLFALSLLAKYTAVLFWPALAWIWFDNGGTWRNARRWSGLILYTIAALAPAVAWIVWMNLNGQIGESGKGYFVRISQWSVANFINAFLSIPPTTARHVGFIVWYPALLTGILALATIRRGRFKELLQRYALPLLIILPWYLQIVYPQAWLENEYYDYVALFGMSILFAAFFVSTFDQITAWLHLRHRELRYVTAAIIVLVFLSNAWDYKGSFHAKYYPWPLVSPSKPFHSALQVNALNTNRESVLTDFPFTLYYTGISSERGRCLCWDPSDEAAVQAVESRNFAYIAFTYPPKIATIEAIQASGYEKIAPGAWRRLPNAPQSSNAAALR